MPQSVAGAFSSSTSSLQSSFISGQGGTPAERIKAQFSAQYELVRHYYENNDQAALKQLLANPLVPEQFKAQLRQGTPAQRISERFDAEYQAIAAAADSGNAASVRAAMAAAGSPKAAADAMAAIVASGNRAALQAALGQLKDNLYAAADAAGAAATTSALAQIRGQLDAQGSTIALQVSQGIKSSFADAISRIYFYLIFVAIAGLVVTLFVPQLPLRKTFDHHPEPQPVE